MTLQGVRDLCVETFPLSTSRQGIMDGLTTIIDRLNFEQIVAEVWLDGSFLTQKIDPVDVDFIVRVEAEFYDKSKGSQREVLDWIDNEFLKDSHKCDCYLLTEWPANHALFALGQSERNRWLDLFGRSRAPLRQEKGLILLTLTGETNEPTA